MLNSEEIIRILLSFFVAGVWITFTTRLAEKAGSKIGGLIANMPSNILISSLFIAVLHQPETLQGIAKGVPMGMAIDAFFIFAMLVLIRFGIVKSVIVSLLVWFILSVIIIAFKLEFGFLSGCFAFILVTALLFYFSEYKLTIHTKPRKETSYSLKQLLVRALFSGTIVATIVYLSEVLPPFWVGIIATFPAVLLSTLVILGITQGIEFARSTAKVLLLSSANIVVYAVGLYYLIPVLGKYGAIGVGLIFSTAIILALRPFLKYIK